MIKIDAQNVDFHYGDFHALKNISMQIEAPTKQRREASPGRMTR